MFESPRKPKSWRISAIRKSSHGYVPEAWKDGTKRHVSSTQGCSEYRISSETSNAAKSDHLRARRGLNVALQTFSRVPLWLPIQNTIRLFQPTHLLPWHGSVQASSQPLSANHLFARPDY
ncbi:hypothetical protein PMIN01_05447 [Paraphaeosphaeria minitans]|uniref:Uncharacterized protein n=1 Tax=Paraphaeosphaeria minitans TaxID=565426 RepID=A0A9P6GM87_9PLEO|nr:hypothetical protein PMIN01_05447 [Paraphaeosphaeria minitans]